MDTNDALTCKHKTCLQRFTLTDRRPRTFICGHSLCSPCCTVLISKAPVKCPICKEETKRKYKNVDELPIDDQVEKVLRDLDSPEHTQDRKIYELLTKDAISCNVCFETFSVTDRRPRSFSCGHSLCTPCCAELVRKPPVKCPTCRKKPDKDVKNVEEIPIAFQVEAILQAFRSSNESTPTPNAEATSTPPTPDDQLTSLSPTSDTEDSPTPVTPDDQATSTPPTPDAQITSLSPTSDTKDSPTPVTPDDQDTLTSPTPCDRAISKPPTPDDQAISTPSTPDSKDTPTHPPTDTQNISTLATPDAKDTRTPSSPDDQAISKTPTPDDQAISTPPTQDDTDTQTPLIPNNQPISKLPTPDVLTTQTIPKLVEELFSKLANAVKCITSTIFCGILFMISISFLTIFSLVLLFGNWKYAHEIINLQNSICEGYLNGNFSKIELEPWNEGIENHGTERSLESMYINTNIYSKSREYSSLIQTITENDSKYSKRYLLVAEQGSGKTTAIKRLLKDWCSNLKKEDIYFRTFKYAIQFNVEGHTYANFEWNFMINNVIPTLPRILNATISKYIHGEGSYLEKAISLYTSITIKNANPILILAFEFRDVINMNTLVETIIQQFKLNSTLKTKANLEEILKREVEQILLVLDGWDEYTKLKYNVGAAPEMEAIIRREERKSINLIVTTRPWKSDELLMIPRYGFQKLSLAEFQLPKDRDNFIYNFFSSGKDAEALINILNGNSTIVPEELQKQPRMLLYICNAWKHDNKIIDDEMKSNELFWDTIWKMMRLTYNRKYPQNPMSVDDLKNMRQEVEKFNIENRKDKNIDFNDFVKKFGKEFDLFYFGLYSMDSYQQISAPWDEDTEDEIVQFVKPVNPTMVDAQVESEINSRTPTFIFQVCYLLFSVGCFVVKFLIIYISSMLSFVLSVVFFCCLIWGKINGSGTGIDKALILITVLLIFNIYINKYFTHAI